MRLNTPIICLCSAVLLPCVESTTDAAENESAYRAISVRNAFALRPAELPTPKQIETVALPRITLAGIHTILGPKYANVIIESADQPARLESFMVREGERVGELEVLTIDETTGTVQVKRRGVIETIDFKRNGLKAAAPALSRTSEQRLIPTGRRRVDSVPRDSMGAAMSPEEQTIAIEVERERLKSLNDPAAALLPPTELSLP